jgi:Pin2-interacting protein X1
MGLSGRVDKQRLSVDPNNKAWSDSTSKLGYRLLSSMGWKSGAGLGKDLDGINKHVSVKLKKDVLGVGADKCTIDNWLDNTSAFDALLESLNEGNKVEEVIVEKKEVKKEESGRNSHRSKWLRNKSVGDFDATSLDQILGVRHGAKKVVEEEKSGGVNMVEYFAKMKSTQAAVDEYDQEDGYGGGIGFGSPGLGLGCQQEETVVALVDEEETIVGDVGPIEKQKKSKKRKRDAEDKTEEGTKSSKEEREDCRKLRKVLKETKKAEKAIKKERKAAKDVKKAEKEAKKVEKEAKRAEKSSKRELKASKKAKKAEKKDASEAIEATSIKCT